MPAPGQRRRRRVSRARVTGPGRRSVAAHYRCRRRVRAPCVAHVPEELKAAAGFSVDATGELVVGDRLGSVVPWVARHGAGLAVYDSNDAPTKGKR